ncbi:NHL repeat-containing protein [Rosettibacter firmus]|uniref:NHL repeat-containing protein n=1 Tax=Rosettibacter firmus TaxID=3111522 RepID=UPI00336BC7FF
MTNKLLYRFPMNNLSKIRGITYYMLILLIANLISLNVKIYAQSFSLLKQIGSFTSAISFSINPAGFIYVTDASTNEIIKLDTLGNILKTIGGYGFDNNSFDFPIDIFSTTLNVYIADKYNDRIQIFDKDLNYISSLSSNSFDNELYKFRYPVGVVVSNQGDIFLIDSDNSRILKFTSAGNFLIEIGSNEFGEYALKNPKTFAITDNKILVIDDNLLLIYDIFGNGISKLQLKEKPNNINATNWGVTFCSDNKIYYSLITNNFIDFDFKTFNPLLEELITDCLIFKNNLYILTPKTIYVFQLIND